MIVRFRATATADDRGDARRAAKVERKRGLPVAGMELADTEPGVTAAAAAARLERDPDVLYAEPDARRTALATFPNDGFFRFEWGLHNTGQTILGVAGTADADIDAPEAWDVTVGDRAVLVAVADSGVDAAHPDLAPNLDPRGYDFVDNDATPQDPDGHGTHVAGTIAAAGNDGLGVTGAAWRASVLPLRVLAAEGGDVSDLIRAYAYAAEAGAKVINLSLGGPDGSRAERDAIAAQAGLLFVVAAGNESVNNDDIASYPCNYELANIVCVAASDQRDALADFSNYGVQSVDLAAPGVSIASTYPGGEWVYMDGTSMATPSVSGVAALLLAADRGATVAELRRALLDGADRKLALAGTTVTGARLNAFGALRELTPAQTPPAEEPPPEERNDQPAPQPAPEPAPAPAPQPAPEPAPAPAPEPAPSPAPAPPPAPFAPRDASAPFVRFTVSPSRDLAAFVRRRALRVTLRCNEPCAVRVELRRGTRVIARGRVAALATDVPARLRLRLGARDRARLRRLRSARLTLRVRAVDPAGNARVVSRRIVLRRR